MKDNTQFIDPSKKSLYGKDGAQFWVGKIVAYADQKEQIEEGFGWRYKVRILGDNSDTDQVEDQYLTYATVLLPTTAGTGGAFKLRSVRLSQGDMVFGVRGGGTAAPKFIIGALPRTRKTTVTNGKFGTLSGFGYSLNDNGILDGEHNEQTGPTTPGASGLEEGEWTKATATNPSEKVKEIVPQVKKKENGEFEEVSEELTEKNDVKKNAGKVVDPLKWEPGTPLNTATMEALKEAFENGSISAQKWEAALKQASEQGLEGYEEYVIKDEIKEVVKEKEKKENKIYFIRGTNLKFDNRDKAIRWMLNHIEAVKKPEYEKAVNSVSGVDIDTQRRYRNWLFIRLAPYVELIKADQQSITSDEIRRINAIYTDFDNINPYSTP